MAPGICLKTSACRFLAYKHPVIPCTFPYATVWISDIGSPVQKSVCPDTFINHTIRVCSKTIPALKPVSPVSGMSAAISVGHCAIAAKQAGSPIAIIFGTVSVGERTRSLRQPDGPIPFESRTSRPDHSAISLGFSIPGRPAIFTLIEIHQRYNRLMDRRRSFCGCGR